MSGCAPASYHRITPEEAKKMMDESSDFILLDVRTESEFMEGHIGGAVLFPHDQIESRAKDELPDKNQLILVYCRSGVRSESASRTLVEMGYKNVYDFGGIIDWPFDIIE
jgi:rhodanese-related sulfurtransferase